MLPSMKNLDSCAIGGADGSIGHIKEFLALRHNAAGSTKHHLPHDCTHCPAPLEKNFIRKMKTGNTEPIYEKYVLKALGILRIKESS